MPNLPIGSIAMLETAHRLTHESLGFEIADVLTTRLTLRGSEYARKDQQVEFYQKILREVTAPLPHGAFR
ncbi:MAG: hypothetical protein ACRD3O_14530 [Terriglobia bacterium]